MAKKALPLILIFAATVLLFYPVLGVYFTGDDFFHFKVAQTDGSLPAFVKLFGFYPFSARGIVFWRPIFREALYNIFFLLWGLNHLPFRVLALTLHLVNIALVYILIQKFFAKKVLSFFTAFFFGITAANVGVLYYLAGGIQAQGATMFVLATLLLFDKHARLSFLTFVLALASHELAVIALPLLFLFGLIQKKSLKRFWPFAVVTALYLYLNFSVIGFPGPEAQYQLNLNIKKAVNTFSWYSAWALGLPEMTIDFVKPGLSLDPRLIRYWGDYFSIIFPAFFAALALLGLAVLYLFLKKRSVFLNKKFLLFVFWFPAGLLPVLFLPWHKSTYYLAPVLPAFWGAVGYLAYKANPKLLGLLAIILLTLNVASVRLGDSTYWAAQRGRIAQRLIDEIKIEYPDLPQGAVVFLKNDPNYPLVAEDWGGTSKQASFILSGSDALQLLYEDPNLKVYYEDLGGVPEDIPEAIVFPITARLQE